MSVYVYVCLCVCVCVCVLVPHAWESCDVVVWYHWRSFISEVILLLCVWTAVNQRQLVVRLQLQPHHLHTKSTEPLFSVFFFCSFHCSFVFALAFWAFSFFFCCFFCCRSFSKGACCALQKLNPGWSLFHLSVSHSLQSTVSTECNLSSIVVTAELNYWEFCKFLLCVCWLSHLG